VCRGRSRGVPEEAGEEQEVLLRRRRRRRRRRSFSREALLLEQTVSRCNGRFNVNYFLKIVQIVYIFFESTAIGGRR